MNFRLQLLLLSSCIFSCVYCTESRIANLAGSGFNVTKAEVADAWQSSMLESDSRCFRHSSVRPGQFDYFHSSDTPDSSGYQWLLLKLNRPVQIKSVTVYGRTDSPEQESIRAQGIEILLSNKRPTSFTSNPPACTSRITPDVSGFHLCGSIGYSEVPGRVYKVNCTDVKDSTFVLLRKFVGNQTDKYMNFRLLNIETAGFCLSSQNTCSETKLSLLKPKDGLMIKAWLPCHNVTRPSTCSIKIGNWTVLPLKTKSAMREFIILQEFIMSTELHGALLQCQHNCSDGSQLETSRKLYISKNPKDFSLDMSVTKLWVVGKPAFFTFSTEGSFPLPVHRCFLVSAADKTNETDKLPDYGEMAPLSSTKAEDVTSSTYNLSTNFGINVTNAHVGAKVRCVYQMPESEHFKQKTAKLPRILKPSQSKFVMPPSISWIDGAVVNVTADSSTDNWVPTSHACLLQSGSANESLRMISSSNMSSTFSVNVSRLWGSSASIACLVNQSGLLETWVRHRLPDVLYPAENFSIKLRLKELQAGVPANFTLQIFEPGNPPAVPSCSVSGRSLTQLKNPSKSNASSVWTISALATDNKKSIACQVVQTAEGKVLFNNSATSETLNVLYASNNSWSATQPLDVKEGEAISVSVTSVGGNPAPSHECWLQVAGSQNIRMNVTHARNATSPRTQDIPQLELVTNFSSTSSRRMNGGSVMCRVSQGSAADLLSNFNQSVNVFYQPPKPEITGLQTSDIYEKVTKNFSVTSGDGNPKVTHKCSADRGLISQLSSKVVSNRVTTEVSFHPYRQSSTIQCSAEQVLNSQTVFNSSTAVVFQVNYMANNSLLISPSSEIAEGSILNVTLESAGGRPTVSELECFLGDLRLFESKFHTRNVTEKSTMTKNFWLQALRVHHKKILRCTFRQDKVLTEWRNSTLIVYYKPNVTLSEPSFNGTHFDGTLRLSGGNPMPEAECFANGNSSSSIFRSEISNRSVLLGNATHALAFVHLEQIPFIEISCIVTQVGGQNFSETYNWTLNSTTEMPQLIATPNQEPQRSMWPLLSPLILLPLLLILAVPVWLHRRRLNSVQLSMATSAAASKTRNEERRSSLELELEFRKSHYLYQNLSNTEYATVVGSVPGLSDSWETLYLPIVGHLDEEGHLVTA